MSPRNIIIVSNSRLLVNDQESSFFSFFFSESFSSSGLSIFIIKLIRINGKDRDGETEATITIIILEFVLSLIIRISMLKIDIKLL